MKFRVIRRCIVGTAAIVATAATILAATGQAASANTVGGVNLGPGNGQHWWGNCKVQDFYSSPYGWAMVSYGYRDGAGYHATNPELIRNGMLWGWLDQGGAPGSMGCPTNWEHGYMVGERQDFQHGILYWNPGMDHAAKLNPAYEGAVAWAWSHNGQLSFTAGGMYFGPGWCLQFAVYSYGLTGHHLIGPYGDKVRAVDWYYDSRTGPMHPGDRNPPRGALAFWDTFAGGTGHAAISLGGGWAISTSFYGNANVHPFKIAGTDHYLGWLAPKW